MCATAGGLLGKHKQHHGSDSSHRRVFGRLQRVLRPRHTSQATTRRLRGGSVIAKCLGMTVGRAWRSLSTVGGMISGEDASELSGSTTTRIIDPGSPSHGRHKMDSVWRRGVAVRFRDGPQKSGEIAERHGLAQARSSVWLAGACESGVHICA